MARVGYVRVSTIEQNLERQIVDLQENAQVEKIFTDKLSGKDTNRQGLHEMLDYVREGDILYISEFSRLARSTQDLLKIIDQLQGKGVQVVSMKEKLDTNTPAGKLMLTVMGAIDTFEREMMLERQREGIAEAKKAGKYKGGKEKAKPQNWQELLGQYKSRQISATKLAELCKVSRPLVYKWIKE